LIGKWLDNFFLFEQLHDNNISLIPKEIGCLEKLTRLNLCRNNLEDLPKQLFRLPELRYLNLSYNKLKELSADVSDLHSLEILVSILLNFD